MAGWFLSWAIYHQIWILKNFSFPRYQLVFKLNQAGYSSFIKPQNKKPHLFFKNEVLLDYFMDQPLGSDLV